jgi:hypothetical protein
MLDVNFFDELRIGLASTENISQKKMAYLMRRSLDQLVTGNVIAVSTSGFDLKESFASDAALR